jgi:hypothetical protein
MNNPALNALRHHVTGAIKRGEQQAISERPPQWTSKIKRFSISGKWYWYRTNDGGMNWRRISTADAMKIIDSLPGVKLA